MVYIYACVRGMYVCMYMEKNMEKGKGKGKEKEKERKNRIVKVRWVCSIISHRQTPTFFFLGVFWVCLGSTNQNV